MEQKAAARWPTTSRELLNAIRDRRDSAAWNRFAAQYSDIVRKFGQRRGLQFADAEDIAQKVLIDVSRQIDRFEYQPERGRFRSWLATIAVRAIWRLRQRQAATCELSLQDLDELQHPADDGWMIDFNTAVLEVGLERIRLEFSTAEWEAFEQNWRHGRPSGEVAAALGQPVSWVYQTKFRALERLKEEIGLLSEDLPGCSE